MIVRANLAYRRSPPPVFIRSPCNVGLVGFDPHNVTGTSPLVGVDKRAWDSISHSVSSISHSDFSFSNHDLVGREQLGHRLHGPTEWSRRHQSESLSKFGQAYFGKPGDLHRDSSDRVVNPRSRWSEGLRLEASCCHQFQSQHVYR